MPNNVSLEPPQTTATRLEKVEKKIALLEQQKRNLLARENEKKRKERTRRLIQIGALALKYLNCPNDMEPTEFEQVLKQRVVKNERHNISF